MYSGVIWPLGVTREWEIFVSEFRDYWSSIWNKFDTIFCLNAIIAFILRQFKLTFWTSRVLMIVNCAIYYIRVFRIYHASRNLGPKLVIFQRMVSLGISNYLQGVSYYHTPLNFSLEIRLIIKIESNLCYPRIYETFEKEWGKKIFFFQTTKYIFKIQKN